MSAVYIPLVVAALSIFGAALVYWHQKNIDRRTALIELRRQAYQDYLKSFVDMTNSPEQVDEITRTHFQNEFGLLIIGSDEVIQAVASLSRFYSETNDDRYNRDVERTKQLIADMCSAMRKDCFEKTHLSKDDITALVPMS